MKIVNTNLLMADAKNVIGIEVLPIILKS